MVVFEGCFILENRAVDMEKHCECECGEYHGFGSLALH